MLFRKKKVILMLFGAFILLGFSEKPHSDSENNTETQKY